MKNIINKISIHPLTYFFIVSGFITGYFNTVIALGLIITTHEFGHIIVIIKKKYHISKIEFLPFGGITRIEKDINSSIKDEILISIFGIFFQSILGFILLALFQTNLIREEFYIIFKNYNLIILIFNMLPIVPLDGHIFIKSVLELVLSFKNSFIISNIISAILLLILIIYNHIFALNNYIIISFLIFKSYESIKNFKHTQNRFFLERYLNNYNFAKTKLINSLNLNKMSKERTHFFKIKDKIIKEYDILRKKFDRKGKIW